MTNIYEGPLLKIVGKIRNNKNRVKRVVGIVSVVVGLRYGKINSIPTSLSSNSTQHVEQVQNSVEEDIQVINTDGKVIKTGSGILISNQQTPESLKSALEIRSGSITMEEAILQLRGGDKSKFGPGARAKADARSRAKTRQGVADAFSPNGNYFPYQKSLSGRRPPKAKKKFFEEEPNKQSAEQCELDKTVKAEKLEIVYRIKENPALVREAQRMGKDQAAQKDVNHLIEQLSLGNENPGIGSEPIGGGISELRGYNEGRVYYRKLRKSKKTVYQVLGKSNKDNQKKVIALVKKYYL